jgi:metal-responsive CopG/Arc/MetJ family transcriptional regulator
MDHQAKTVLSRKRGPKPTGKGLMVGVRLQPALLDRLDAYRETLSDAPSRPEAIRSMVEAMLQNIDKDGQR